MKILLIVLCIVGGLVVSNYGVNIKNTSSDIQIDGTYRNMSYWAGGDHVFNPRGTSSSPYTWVSFTTVGSSITRNVPIGVWRPSLSYYSVIEFPTGGSNPFQFYGFRFRGSVIPQILSLGGLYTQTINWKAYTDQNKTDDYDYKILVRNPKGEICFDSSLDTLRIMEVHTVTLGDPAYSYAESEYEDITHTDVKNPWYYVQYNYNSVPKVEMRWTSGGRVQYNTKLIGLKRLSSTSVRVGWFNIYTNWNTPGSTTPSRTYTPSNPIAYVYVCK